MAIITLPNVITSDMLIDFSVFGKKNDSYVDELLPLRNLEASSELINFIVRTEKYTPYVHLDVDDNKKIGYNLVTDIGGTGLTEANAYTIFINELKIAERKLKKLLPINTISQSQYDALLSVYYRTGTFNTVGTVVRKFDIYNYIKDRKWNYVATALIESGNNRNVRQGEAKLLMTGDYGIEKDRSFIKDAALKKLEREYLTGMLDTLAKKQAEYVYYKETGRFLPTMQQSRQRLLANS